MLLLYNFNCLLEVLVVINLLLTEVISSRILLI